MKQQTVMSLEVPGDTATHFSGELALLGSCKLLARTRFLGVLCNQSSPMDELMWLPHFKIISVGGWGL